MDWNAIAKDAVEGPCTHCPELKVSYPQGTDHVSMPVTRPAYVDSYIEGLTGPNEQHTLDPEANCVNPKCGYHFSPEDEAEIRQNNGEFTCPRCGYTYDYYGSQKNPTYMRDLDYEDQAAWSATKARPANPGGMTRSGLTLSEMGNIGEEVVLRMGELPGIGAIRKASDQHTFPIDAIVESQRGNFGCEIKTNHSQAQERFKLGGKEERLAKIKYCLANGLKPALIGVRLNFFTDKAYIFFREGLVDTWVGNQQMLHVATVDFADLNPFKSPDPQAQAIAVENAHLPDQSEEEEFASIFGQPEPVMAATKESLKHTFTIPFDVHDLKVVDKKGKWTHNIRRCPHCGILYQRKSDHHGHFECPTCGKDVDDKPRRLSKVVLARPTPVSQLAREWGWNPAGRSGEGHLLFHWTDPSGVQHVANVGAGVHGDNAQMIDLQRGRQRMRLCMNGKCEHVRRAGPVEQQLMGQPGMPVFRAGQTVEIDDHAYFIQEIDGNLVLAFDMQTGEEAYFEREGEQLVRAAGWKEAASWSSL